MSIPISDKPLRWGILSTAGIARKNWQAIRNSGNGIVAAVASRDEAKAAQFIAECQADAAFPDAPRAIGSYAEIIAAPDIDAVYIPLPTGVRKEWVIKAAQAGKHVMCEKPCAPSLADLEEMVAACRAAGVQFMDGIMYMHSDRLPALRAVLDDGESIGQMRRIACGFSFCAPDDFLKGNIRMHSGLEPQGCLGDLGWYTIRFALFATGYQMPARVRATMLDQLGRADSPDAVPVEFSAELFFPGGVSATFYNSFQTEHQQWAHISGTKGSLLVSDFVLPYCGSELEFTVSNAHFDVANTRFVMERHDRRHAIREYSNNHENAQETKLFRRFADLALSGTPDNFWPDAALKTQKIMDACLLSARQGGTAIEIA